MLVSFSLACNLKPEGKDHKVIDYVMSGNISAQLASQLIQQLVVLEAVKKAKTEMKPTEENPAWPKKKAEIAPEKKEAEIEREG